MKRNVHVAAACDRVIELLATQVHALNLQRDGFYRIRRLPFAEADDLRHAANLNQLADTMAEAMEAQAALALEELEAIEQLSRIISAGSMKRGN